MLNDWEQHKLQQIVRHTMKTQESASKWSKFKEPLGGMCLNTTRLAAEFNGMGTQRPEHLLQKCLDRHGDSEKK